MTKAGVANLFAIHISTTRVAYGRIPGHSRNERAGRQIPMLKSLCPFPVNSGLIYFFILAYYTRDEHGLGLGFEKTGFVKFCRIWIGFGLDIFFGTD